MTEKQGSRKRILDFLLANIGRVIEGDELREASGNVSEWARRVRELRDEEGYQILTHRDRRDLKPGQYLLETAAVCLYLPVQFPKKPVLMSLNVMDIPVRCAVSRQVILTLLIRQELYDSQWDIS